MIYLDLALRSGAVTLLLLLAALLWRAPISWEGRLSVFAVAVTESAFMVTTAALPLDLPTTLQSNLILLTSLKPAALTWLIVTIFLDAPGRRWPWLIASLVTSAAHYANLSFPDAPSYCLPMAMLLFGALLALSLWTSRDDLVECRCHARPGFAAAIAGLALFLTSAQFVGALENGTVLLALSQSAGTLFVALAFSVWLLRPDADRWPGETTSDEAKDPPTQDKFADPALIARIEAAMAGRIWKEEGLTIGALATKLAVPEHRLRRAINQGLGYRNFSSFINQARIEAACAALTNPALMSTTVLEIAYDVGFSSMGPFNRAFRAEIGQSPTEYRRRAQAGPFPDSDGSSSITAKLH